MKSLFFSLLAIILFSQAKAQSKMAVVKGGYHHEDEWGEWRTVYNEEAFSILCRTRLCHYMDERGCSAHFGKIQFKREYHEGFLTPGRHYDIRGNASIDGETTTCSGKTELKPVQLTIYFNFAPNTGDHYVYIDNSEHGINVINSIKVKITYKKIYPAQHTAVIGDRG